MDTTVSAPIGQLLDGRYLVESQLARGGMATVYLGRDIRLDRAVALKIAHPELARDPEFTRRFIGEAHAVAKLSSPNVVAVFDQGSTGDIKYIAMEYVPGPTLRELLNARGRLGPRETLDILEGVLAGLSAAHEAGIVHRDVKPENVLLGSGAAVKVADFGLARAVAGMRNTKSGLLIGTAAYLAPEQVAAGTSDSRTDVYAAGVMLFEMLTGVQPHTGDSPLAVAYQHVNAAVPAPSTLMSGLPSALDALVALSTSRDPELRPPDAGHFLHAITQVRSGMPVPDLRRGAHAAPTAAAVRSQPPYAGNGATFSAATTAAVRGPGRADAGGADGERQSATAALARPNNTMIVPAETGYGSSPRRPSHGYREPFLQKWLFSRRILAVLAALVIGTAIWWLASGQYFAVPKVTGMTLSTARADLANAGLRMHLGARQHSYTVPAGDVISTDPAAGAQVRHGQAVTLIVSSGPLESVVPGVTGQPLADAEKALEAVGLTPGKPTPEASATVPAGLVISTSPVAGTDWPRNKPVGITVSAGPPLPNFAGMQFPDAQAAAQQLGVTLQEESVNNSTQPANTIVKQSPAAGTPVSSNEVVTVWVSAGPPMVPVPDVSGMTIKQATKVLSAAGFQVSVNDPFGGATGSTVTNYQPQGTAPEGATITIDIGVTL
jgi:eukaryotic-like serine/threonine-protein kinase